MAFFWREVTNKPEDVTLVSDNIAVRVRCQRGTGRDILLHIDAPERVHVMTDPAIISRHLGPPHENTVRRAMIVFPDGEQVILSCDIAPRRGRAVRRMSVLAARGVRIIRDQPATIPERRTA